MRYINLRLLTYLLLTKHNLLTILHSREIRCKLAEKVTDYHTVGEWRWHTENVFQKTVEITKLWWILHIKHKKTKEKKFNRFGEAPSINHGNGNLITQDKVLVLAAKEQWLQWCKLLLAIFFASSWLTASSTDADWKTQQKMNTYSQSQVRKIITVSRQMANKHKSLIS